MSDGTPWERQPGETDKAYAAFRLYRDQHPSNRTMEAAREALGKASGYLRVLEEWSSRYAWVERVKAYDAWVDTIRRDERERGFRDEERLRFQRRRELVEREQRIADRALSRVEQALAGPMFRKTIKDTENGSITIIEPTNWSFKDLASVFVLADRRARLALDMFGDPARAPTPEPEGAGTSDVDRYIEGLLTEALQEETPSGQ